MAETKVQTLLKGLTTKQRQLVVLIYLKGEYSLKQAISKVKGDRGETTEECGD